MVSSDILPRKHWTVNKIWHQTPVSVNFTSDDMIDLGQLIFRLVAAGTTTSNCTNAALLLTFSSLFYQFEYVYKITTTTASKYKFSSNSDIVKGCWTKNKSTLTCAHVERIVRSATQSKPIAWLDKQSWKTLFARALFHRSEDTQRCKAARRNRLLVTH